MARSRLPSVAFRRKGRAEFGKFRIIYRGHRSEQRTLYRTKEEAEAERKLLEMQLRARFLAEETGTGPGVQEQLVSMTLGQLVDLYKTEGLVRRGENTRKTTGKKLDMVASAIGRHVSASAVDTAVVERWLTARLKSAPMRRGKGGDMVPGKGRVSPTTVYGELNVLGILYRWAIRRKCLRDPWAPGQPMRALPWELSKDDKPRRRTHRRRRVEDKVLVKLARKLKPQENEADLYLGISLFTGARGEDLKRLRWAQWDRRVGAWRIEEAPEDAAWEDGGTSKTGQPVTWPMPPRFAALVAAQRAAAAEEAEDGEVPEFVFLPAPGPRRLMKRAEALCGAPGIGVQALRHSFGSALAAAGVHPRLIKALMGHRGQVEQRFDDTTEGYIEPTVAELRAAVLKLPWSEPWATAIGRPSAAKKTRNGGKTGAETGRAPGPTARPGVWSGRSWLGGLVWWAVRPVGRGWSPWCPWGHQT